LNKPEEKVPVVVEGLMPAFSASLIAAVLYGLLPSPIALGPSWILLVTMTLLMSLLAVLRQTGRFRLAHYLGHTSTALMTCFIAYSLICLVVGIFRGTVVASVMLRSSGILWVMNVIVFALWYWRLDAGGPMARAHRGSHEVGCFLFPQMMMRKVDAGPWIPHFIDYLFLAFNTSTAFSPTDTAILSRWAKLLVMTQSIISLGLVVLVVSRAVNVI
jgi:uncharacterized membrane protein